MYLTFTETYWIRTTTHFTISSARSVISTTQVSLGRAVQEDSTGPMCTIVCVKLLITITLLSVCSCSVRRVELQGPVVSRWFSKTPVSSLGHNLYMARISSSVIIHNTFPVPAYNMIKPMMQNPISPAMELCICWGIAPPVT